MREIWKINNWKIYVNYKTLFIERQYIFMSLAEGSCVVTTSSWENRSNNMSTLGMFINMAAEGNVNVGNLVQFKVQHSAFRETIYSILTATNQKQLCLLGRLNSRNVWGASHHSHLEFCQTSCQTSTMELICGNSQRP